MKLFYRILLWLTERDLDFARATGRNPDAIAALVRDREDYRLALWRLSL